MPGTLTRAQWGLFVFLVACVIIVCIILSSKGLLLLVYVCVALIDAVPETHLDSVCEGFGVGLCF